MTSLPVTNNSASSADGIRQINLRTDLAALADLIELVFADSMNQGGRAAVREMRYLSQISMGISLVPGLNDLTHGINMGYVWIADGKLVGNVSVYPARQPDDDQTWVIVNVGVHPDYRRLGIATQLMRASLDFIRARGGQHAILQVASDNAGARRMYEHLGFREERAWILWRRSGSSRLPAAVGPEASTHIAHRRPSEWQLEYELAQRIRPNERGGLGWLRPLNRHQFRKSWLTHIADWMNMRSTERLVIRAVDESQILASLWIERSFLASTTHLTLLVDPEYQGLYEDILIGTAIRRFGGRSSALMIEHPADETTASEVLRGYMFRPQREMLHMRWDN